MTNARNICEWYSEMQSDRRWMAPYIGVNFVTCHVEKMRLARAPLTHPLPWWQYGQNIQYRRKWKGQTDFKLNELNKHWCASVHLANKTIPGLPLSYVDSSSRKRYPAVYFQYPVKCECPKKVITVRRLAFPHARPNIPLRTDRINAQLEWIRGLWYAI